MKYVLCVDISDECYNGRTISTYITTGMGKSDSVVIIIAKPDEVQCTLTFHVSQGNHIAVVVEFPDWISGQELCGNSKNRISVKAGLDKTLNICSLLNPYKDDAFRSVAINEMSIIIDAPHDLNTLKIIATSLRDTKVEGCSFEEEIQCTFGSRVFCMSKFVACDTHLNCGLKDQFDGDTFTCIGYSSVPPGVIILGIGTVFISTVVLVAVLRNILPTRKGHFIFKQDETLSDKDRVSIEKHVVLKTRLLYGHGNQSGADQFAYEEETRREKNDDGKGWRRRFLRRKKPGKS